MEKLNLRLFDETTYTVTVHKDAGITTATPSAESGAKNTEITLTITPASGYELDEIEVVAGGVTVNQTTKKFKIGEANVILFVKSKADNVYKVVENTIVNINGSKTELKRNMNIKHGPNGAVIDVECSGTALTISEDAIKYLLQNGAIVKI